MKSKNSIQAVILAAGTGKRVFPLAVNQAKPMFRLLGKPLLDYVIENLKKEGIRDLIIIIGHNSEQIKNYFSDGRKFGVKIKYVLQKEALGMANALLQAKDLVDDNFLVLNADDFFESSLIKKLLTEHKKSKAEIILTCQPVEETWKFGIIDCDEKMNVNNFIEKPEKGKEPTNLAVIGVYLMNKEIFKYYKKVKLSDQQYEEAILKFIKDNHKVKAIKYSGFFASYKYPWDLFVLNEYLLNKFIKKRFISTNTSISPRASIIGNVFIGKNVKIMEGATIKGPAYIGHNCLIGNNALIWSNSSIGDNSVIGYSTEIKNSIIGENCWFHSSYVGDSIILDNCSFGAGTITSNFRFDEKTIKVNILNKGKIDSNRDKLGAIMAENCKTGSNSTIMPGIKIGPNSIVGANVFLKKDLEPNKVIILKEDYLIKDNNIVLEPKKKSELMKRLLKYK